VATSAADITARLVDIAATDLRRRVDEAVARMGDAYRDAAPNHSGALAGAWRTEVRERGELSITVHGEVDDSAAPHGKWINEPVDEIVPRNATVLHWFSYSGEEVFARRVRPSRAHEGWWRDFIDGPLTDAVLDS
jgi:hypothetical protein